MPKKGYIKSKIFSVSGGLGYQRQIVVDNSNGEYILWIESDTVISRDYVKKLIEFMEQNPHVGIAKGEYDLKITSNVLSMLEVFSRYAEKLVEYKSFPFYIFHLDRKIFKNQRVQWRHTSYG